MLSLFAIRSILSFLFVKDIIKMKIRKDNTQIGTFVRYLGIINIRMDGYYCHRFFVSYYIFDFSRD